MKLRKLPFALLHSLVEDVKTQSRLRVGGCCLFREIARRAKS
jgi:hypothetical protein